MGFLTILKLLSMIISGIVGIVASSTETRDKKKRINKVGRILLTLSSCSLLIGIIAQVIESRQTYIASTQARKQFENLSETSQKQLSYTEKMAGKFDYLSIDTSFEFEPLNETAVEFADNAVIYATAGIKEAIKKAREALGKARHKEDIVGYIPVGPRGTIIMTDKGVLKVVENFDVFVNSWNTDRTLSNQLNTLVACLKSPVLELQLFSKATQQSGDSNPDFSSLTEGGKFRFFYAESNKLYMDFEFECPKTNWHQNVRMTSVTDLDNAKVNVAFTNAFSLNGYYLRPVGMRLDCGKCTLSAGDFKFHWANTNPKSGTTNYGYESILPTPDTTLKNL